ncbi:ribbon-helix-helix domain-containing protein, partial [Myxococcus xanthus]|uniref:ribbon-helix-helix domain-containing protein n=1 Tax=Myxococcus xanthus TaxID=34 RepID=UPI00148B9254
MKLSLVVEGRRRIKFEIDEDLLYRLEQLAQKTGQSREALINEVLGRHLKEAKNSWPLCKPGAEITLDPSTFHRMLASSEGGAMRH